MLYLELHVLKVFSLIELKTAMIMYKVNKKYLPANLQIMFMMSLGTPYATRQSKNIRQVFARTTQRIHGGLRGLKTP